MNQINNFQFFPKEEFIETVQSGNRISKKTVLGGSQNIKLAGKVRQLFMLFGFCKLRRFVSLEEHYFLILKMI
jgi:hypothetical protein